MANHIDFSREKAGNVIKNNGHWNRERGQWAKNLSHTQIQMPRIHSKPDAAVSGSVILALMRQQEKRRPAIARNLWASLACFEVTTRDPSQMMQKVRTLKVVLRPPYMHPGMCTHKRFQITEVVMSGNAEGIVSSKTYKVRSIAASPGRHCQDGFSRPGAIFEGQERLPLWAASTQERLEQKVLMT